MAAATAEATRTASFALDCSVGSVSASSVMHSATVNPIPAAVPTPTTCSGSAPSGLSACPALIVTRVATTMPSGLPSKRPSSTPHVIADPAALRPQRRRDPTPSDSKDANSERNVGDHWNRPPPRSGATSDHQAHEGRHDHAPKGGDAGQDRSMPGGQVAIGELAFDLEPDDEKEDRHPT
jgi:hypothetical protein